MAVMIKRGDTRTAIRASLVEANGAAADLTGAAVRFLAADLKGSPLVARAADVLDATRGTVLFAWEPPETDKAGTYRAEFEVAYPDGRTQTYPNDGYITIEILPDLG